MVLFIVTNFHHGKQVSCDWVTKKRKKIEKKNILGRLFFLLFYFFSGDKNHKNSGKYQPDTY
jgi:hypothetical protein